MATQPTIARIWRGRTRPDVADRYEAYLKTDGIPLLEKTALGVQLFREDRKDESWFTTISYWSDLDSMTAFTGGEPTKVHQSRPRFRVSDRTPRIHPDPPDRHGPAGLALIAGGVPQITLRALRPATFASS
jgi:hypothetical protein